MQLVHDRFVLHRSFSSILYIYTSRDIEVEFVAQPTRQDTLLLYIYNHSTAQQFHVLFDFVQ